jgi:membrane protease subunit (stomatin/prohibitin family)
LEDIRQYDKFQVMDKAIKSQNFAKVKKNMEMFLIAYIKEKYLPRVDELLQTAFQQRNYF